LHGFAEGDYFPVWGTCQGFQLLSILAADNTSVLETYAYDSENLPLALDFTSLAPQSRLWGQAPQDIYEIFSSENITINLHHDGVPPNEYSQNSKLSAAVNLLSTNVDRKGKPFGSSLEHKVAPIYATQFHPERNAFEWDLPELTPHTPDAINAMEYLANFLVTETRKNQHKFKTPMEEAKALIYNWNPMYTIDFSDNYPEEQTYFFDKIPSPFRN